MDLVYFISCFFSFLFLSCLALTLWMVGILVSLYISHSYLFDLEGYWTIEQGTSLGAELPNLSFFAFSCSTTLKWVSSFSLSHPTLHSPLHVGPYAVLD